MRGTRVTIYLNNNPIPLTTFPDKTSQVWKMDTPSSPVIVRWEFHHEGELVHLCQLKQLLDSWEVEVTLHIPYLPYGRQDKGVDNEQTFGLHTFSKILNSFNFKKVIILDPHSEEALKLINNSEAEYPRDVLSAVFDISGSDLVCYPDRGALVKYTKIYDLPYISAEKDRDPLTGYITFKKVNGDVKGKRVLIVDDICDGGMTFKLLASRLLEKEAKGVCLFVTHGLFSKGLQTLYDSGITQIYKGY